MTSIRRTVVGLFALTGTAFMGSQALAQTPHSCQMETTTDSYLRQTDGSRTFSYKDKQKVRIAVSILMWADKGYINKTNPSRDGISYYGRDWVYDFLIHCYFRDEYCAIPANGKKADALLDYKARMSRLPSQTEPADWPDFPATTPTFAPPHAVAWAETVLDCQNGPVDIKRLETSGLSEPTIVPKSRPKPGPSLKAGQTATMDQCWAAYRNIKARQTDTDPATAKPTDAEQQWAENFGVSGNKSYVCSKYNTQRMGLARISTAPKRSAPSSAAPRPSATLAAATASQADKDAYARSVSPHVQGCYLKRRDDCVAAANAFNAIIQAGGNSLVSVAFAQEQKLTWSRHGCDLGDGQSCARAAYAYATGTGVAKSEVMSLKWRRKALNLGFDPDSPEPPVTDVMRLTATGYATLPRRLCPSGMLMTCSKFHNRSIAGSMPQSPNLTAAISYYSWVCLNPVEETPISCSNTSRLLMRRAGFSSEAKLTAKVFSDLSCRMGYEEGCRQSQEIERSIQSDRDFEWRMAQEKGGLGQFLADLATGIGQAQAMGSVSVAQTDYPTLSRPSTSDPVSAAQDWRNFDSALRATSNIGTGYNSNCPASNPYC
ncbi:hypothetical protein ACFFUB_02010 [Algimonas porphyrae]|uniref:Uncharacterized protein n=1 Tax=Algimonas porphyrae TaxID=1128113 RepID=A0ABQ5V1B0_9PROT|nr:hypothetical protein [Algimonas porphyrae]GLQ20815.1 hypothetical protein GCM10007854_17700 [Algimonas porphyrae]